MAKETTYAGKLGDWRRLLEPIANNAAELAHLEVPRANLAALLEQAVDANRDQGVHKAAKQRLSKLLVELTVEGDRLANLLRVAVKQHYGIRSEKLSEFGLQPFRGRPRKSAAVPIEIQSPQLQPAETAG